MPLEEKKKSRLYALKPLTDRLPAVTRPEGHVQFRTKMFWVVAILVLYFVMTNIYIYGLDRTNVIDFFSSLRAILAGAQGSLMHLGIVMIFVEAIPQVYGFLTPAQGFVRGLNGPTLFGLLPAGNGANLAKLLIIVQLFLGSY